MNAKHYLASIAAFSIWGFFSLPLRAIAEYASLDILVSRLAIASVLMVLLSYTLRKKQSIESWEFFKKQSKKDKKRLLTVNLVSAVMLAINWYLFIYVMNNISVNATALAYMLCPIITTILAYIFLKDRLTSIQWIAIALSALSCILLSFGDFVDVFYSFLIGLSYAVYLVLQKNNHQLDRFFTLAFQIVVGTILLLPSFGYMHSEPVKGSFFYAIIFLIAILFTIVPMFLNVYSLNKLSSSTAGIFIYLNPIISFLLALFYFNEAMSPLKITAYMMVFFSVILFNSRVLLQLMKIKRA